MLIGMKIDLDFDRVVTTEEGIQFAKKEGLLFAETSSKLNINIKESFTNLIIEIYNRQNLTSIPKLKYNDNIPQQSQQDQQTNSQQTDSQQTDSQQTDNKNAPVKKQENENIDDANFFYKNVLYPFNFELFANHSQYFKRNQNLFQDKKLINLVNEFENATNISPESIHELIEYSKSGYANINVSNVFDLFYLSNKYEIKKLQMSIQQSMLYNYKSIMEHAFSTHNENNISHYIEEIIAKNLFFFINECKKQTLSLPFHSIYRILLKYSSIEGEQNIHDSEINDFLIEIIKIHGIQIFHLLLELKIMKINSKCLNELILQYLTGVDINNADPTAFLIISEANKEIKKLQNELKSLKDENTFHKNIIQSNINSLTIPPFMNTIGDRYFEGQTQLKTIIFSESLISIGEYTFAECSMITQITIPSSVATIGSGAFKDCISLTQVNILSQLTKIESHLFQNCSSLKKIEIPSSVEEIGVESFAYCKLLKKVSFKNNKSELKKIGEFAFNNCHALTTISIPQNAQFHEIGINAFNGCYLLDLKEIGI